MEKIAFTIREDVCDQNTKTPEMIAALKETMSKYGTLVPYDTDIAAVKAEYQATIDSLTSQLDAIRANDLSAYEVDLVNCFRLISAKMKEVSDKDNQELRDALDKANNRLTETIQSIQSVISAKTV